MKVRLLLLVCLATATFQASAGTVFGGADCGQWFNKARQDNAKMWLSGYLSGLNSAIGKQLGDPLGKLGSMEQAFLWVNNYCAKNPLSSLAEAGNTLYIELQNRNNNVP